MTAWIIRPAAEADLRSIAVVIRDAYTKYIDRIGKPPGPMLDDYDHRVRENSVWVLVDRGQIAAVLVLVANDDHLLLDNVAVGPCNQGKGMGRALTKFAEQEARRRGYREIRLYTHQMMQENIAMYFRLGYEEFGRGEQAGYQRVFLRKGLG